SEDQQQRRRRKYGVILSSRFTWLRERLYNSAMIAPETGPKSQTEPSSTVPAVLVSVRRYVPLIVWVIVLFTMILIPAKIISYGYLPADDALRHAAKAVSGKPWSEILVMRSDFLIDP